MIRLACRHNWKRILRDVFASREPAVNAAILFHGYVGKRAFVLSRRNAGDQYGQVGSRSVVWQLATWRDRG